MRSAYCGADALVGYGIVLPMLFVAARASRKPCGCVCERPSKQCRRHRFSGYLVGRRWLPCKRNTRCLAAAGSEWIRGLEGSRVLRPGSLSHVAPTASVRGVARRKTKAASVCRALLYMTRNCDVVQAARPPTIRHIIPLAHTGQAPHTPHAARRSARGSTTTATGTRTTATVLAQGGCHRRHCSCSRAALG